MIIPLLFLAQTTRQPLDFAFFGCNRVSDEVEKAQKAENFSSANVSELKGTFRDIAKTNSEFVFVVGDLVNGYADDKGEHLKSQLDAWPSLVTLNQGVNLVVAPGNHELNLKRKKLKLANPATDAVWTNWLRQNHYAKFGGNGPTPESDLEDKLATDQSMLNYSFTVGSTHFIVLNTDTRTTETMPGSTETKVAWIPAKWVADDIARAETDPGIRDVFLLGHRNLVDPVESKEEAPIDRGCAAKVVAAFAASTKVRAYLCAHVHAYDFKRIEGTKAVQVVVGNGGSDLDESWKPATGRWFGFGVVRIHEDGKIGLVLYKRPAPEKTRAVTERTPVSLADPEILLTNAGS
ncbi:MAG: metallophosphoesterase [Armatimonadota bacterium]